MCALTICNRNGNNEPDHSCGTRNVEVEEYTVVVVYRMRLIEDDIEISACALVDVAIVETS
jgi:hypothetical protein